MPVPGTKISTNELDAVRNQLQHTTPVTWRAGTVATCPAVSAPVARWQQQHGLGDSNNERQ